MQGCPVCKEELKGKSLVAHFDQQHLAILEAFAAPEANTALCVPGTDDALLIDLLWPPIVATLAVIGLMGTGLLPQSAGLLTIIGLSSLALVLVTIAVFTGGPRVPGEKVITGLVSVLVIEGNSLTLHRRFLPNRRVDLSQVEVEIGVARWVIPSAIHSSYNASLSHMQSLGDQAKRGGSWIRLVSPEGSVCIGNRSHGIPAFTRRWSGGYATSGSTRSHIHCRLGKAHFLDLQVRLFQLGVLQSRVDFDSLGIRPG